MPRTRLPRLALVATLSGLPLMALVAGEIAPAGTAISYRLGTESRSATIAIVDPLTGEAFRTLQGTTSAGLNGVQWDLRGDPPENGKGNGFGGNQGPTATPGVYRVRLSVDGAEHETTVRVLEDVWISGS